MAFLKRRWLVLAAAIVLPLLALFAIAMRPVPPPLAFLHGGSPVDTSEAPKNTYAAHKRHYLAHNKLESLTYCISADWDSLLKEAKVELETAGYRKVFSKQGRAATFYGPKSHGNGVEMVALWNDYRYDGKTAISGARAKGWVTIEVQNPEPEGTWNAVLRWLKIQ
jgi:hypothetical protein